ncbi:esterase B1-like [Ochlerotatus camptorhynchus]|uniref:esterase B1-like n=1 Tax=Ochlerotatus camptorhynchus TaxID=644619 RepID=UPI0031E35C1A
MDSLAKIKLGLVILICFIKYRLKSLWQKYYFGYRRPTVQLSAGKVRGLTERLPNGEAYHFFKGIPYAKPPIGKLRFQPPVPIQKYESAMIDCSVHRNEFIQLNFLTDVVLGSEDGLYLNVYSPELPDRMNTAPNLPVMIFLYGGGFQEGSGDSFIYDPIDLVQSGVIVVTFNYRLGPLGFLCLPSEGIYGNMGLKDQRLAFQWVQQNIVRFGGNPNNVTLFGVSAGTISGQIHYLSVNSRNLFHRVISQSCTGFTLPYLQADPVTKSRKLAHLVKGSELSSDKDALDVLMRAPAHRLVKLQNEVGSTEDQYETYKFYFRACVEPVANEDSVLTETPETILKRYDTFDMPMITGGADTEGGLSVYLLLNRLKHINDNPEHYLISTLVRDADIADRDDLIAAIKKFYFGDKSIDRNSLRELSDLMTDVDFAAHQMVATEWISKYQPRVRHYNYRFTFAGRYGIMDRVLGMKGIGGTWHGDDAFYIFKPGFISQLSKHSDEQKVKNTFIQLWTSFAKYGEPVLGDSKECEWLPVKTCDGDMDIFQLDCLNIDVETKMVYNPCEQRVEFWRGVLKKYKKDFL